jgi:tetratricopeptide (TPR) repeat protein
MTAPLIPNPPGIILKAVSRSQPASKGIACPRSGEGLELAKEFPNYILLYYLLGCCYEAQGDLDNAYACFIKNAEVQPYNPYAHRCCGMYHVRYGKLAEAAFKRGPELYPNGYPEMYMGLAKIYSDRWDSVKLKEALKKGVDATWNPGLVLALAQVLQIEGQDQERTNMLRKALEKYPDNADLKVALAGSPPKTP